MQSKKSITPTKRKNKKDLIILIVHVHFLIVSLIAVLWVRGQLKERSQPTKLLERKARLLIPENSP